MSWDTDEESSIDSTQTNDNPKEDLHKAKDIFLNNALA